jgi:hypothetical protein
MKNAFDSDNYPDQVPDQLVAGDRWAWTRSDITTAYPTTLYTLTFRFRPLDLSSAAWTVTAGKVSSAHVVEVSQATTAAYVSAECSWSAIVIRDSDSEEVTVDSGTLTILPEATGTPGTASSWVYETLAAIRAVLKGTASKEDAAYSIGGRSLSRRTPAELLDLEREFSKRWQAEKDEIERQAGRATNRRVLVKMSA